MATYKEEAVVLRAYDLGEADRIVSLLTAERGLRRAVAKGIKRTGSKFGARLEPFTHMNALLHQGRNLDTVTQVEIVRSHAGIREDYDKFLYGEAMLEMIEKSLHENQSIPRLFHALCLTLDALEEGTGKAALLLAAFELKVCALIGYLPQLETCLHCGRHIEDEKAWLDLVEGGVTCLSCQRGPQNLIALSPHTLSLVRGLLADDMATICGRDENPRLTREALQISFRFSEGFLERPLKAHRVVTRYLDQNN